MADKQPTFAERTQQMRDNATAVFKASEVLADIATSLDAEFDRMAAAEKRFAERRSSKVSVSTTRC